MFRSEAALASANAGNQGAIAAPPPPKGIEINTCDELFNYLKNSKQLGDFTRMGIDNNGFKSALHKLLVLVVSSLTLAQNERRADLREEWLRCLAWPQPEFRAAGRTGGL